PFFRRREGSRANRQRCSQDPSPARKSAGLREDTVLQISHGQSIIFPMPLVDQIQKDIVTARKAKDEARLSTLRMVKSALQLKTVEKMSPLDDKESQAVLATLIKQRKESIEQFNKGGRQEMADKEAAEIVVIESYLPKAASEADIAAGVKAAIAEMGSPTMKEM